MQFTFTVKNLIVGSALIAGAVYAYNSFYKDIDTKDMRKLIREHRSSSAARQHVIRTRARDLYRPDEHFGIVVEALDHTSPVTQAFAVDILAANPQAKALPKLLAMLNDTTRQPSVKAELARAFRVEQFWTKKAIPRLIKLTDEKEDIEVRGAAHNTLQAISGTGARITLGVGTREKWNDWWDADGRKLKLK